MTEEVWRDIEGYEGLYQVSNIGRVKSIYYSYTGKEKILKLYKNKKTGYLQVMLYKNNKGKIFTVHRLVATAFIPNQENKLCIDHINTIRTDNRVDNLRWVTYKENSNNPISKISGLNNPKARVVLQFTNDGTFIRKWNCIMDIQRVLGISQSSISACCQGKRKTCGGFKWKYV